MENKKNEAGVIRVMICDDTVAGGTKIAANLSRLGMYAYTRKKDGATIIHSILSENPDIVVADLSLDGTDAVSVMEKVRSIVSESPAFIVLSDIKNDFIERQVIASGASAVLVKPVDAEGIYAAINSVFRRRVDGVPFDAEIMVTELIQKIGIPAHVRGYEYIRTAILECIEDRECLNSITKQLYPRVAAKHETTSSKVERAIRHAIDMAWQRGDRGNIYSFFGYRESNYRPTNSEFISLAADKIRLSIKSNFRYKNIVGF